MVEFDGFESIAQVQTVFRIKICGVRLEQDVRAVEAAGGDAIGLNFFAPSVRFVDPAADQTRELSALAGRLGLLRVGVFVNESAASIQQIAESVDLDAIQLHGDETIDLARQISAAGMRVIRAIKLPKGPLAIDQIESLAAPWSQAGCHLLLDADAGAAHGGSGKTLNWPSVAAWAEQHRSLGWTLAGGLKPENVAEAIRVSGAVSVDTASGVECPKGVKNEGRIREFVRQASGLVGS